MEVKSTNELVEAIISIAKSDNDNKKQLIHNAIVNYGNVRCKASIEKAWSQTREIMARAFSHRRKRLYNNFLEADYFTGMISIPMFIHYIETVEDKMKVINELTGDEGREAVAACHDAMLNNISTKIDIDRRRSLPFRETE